MKSKFLFIMFMIMILFVLMLAVGLFFSLKGDWKIISIAISGFLLSLVLILFRAFELLGL